MKFPSFIKTSNHSRFHFEPRYYDPVKEEIKAKIEAAKKNAKNGDSSSNYNSSISAAFSRRERKTGQTSMVQMIIAAALFGTFVGWMFYGNDVFYIFLVLSPLYFYFRLKGKSKPKE
ncbi:MAG: hypothetical protein JXR07_04680 [Reichenbachiella sp.]